jgi:hypothetical protein
MVTDQHLLGLRNVESLLCAITTVRRPGRVCSSRRTRALPGEEALVAGRAVRVRPATDSRTQAPALLRARLRRRPGQIKISSLRASPTQLPLTPPNPNKSTPPTPRHSIARLLNAYSSPSPRLISLLHSPNFSSGSLSKQSILFSVAEPIQHAAVRAFRRGCSWTLPLPPQI